MQNNWILIVSEHCPVLSQTLILYRGLHYTNMKTDFDFYASCVLNNKCKGNDTSLIQHAMALDR